MTMREIQDLTLQRERGLEQVEARFAARRSAFIDELLKLANRGDSPQPIGVRVTLVPLTAGLWAEQVYRRPDIQPVNQEFLVRWSGAEYTLPTLGSYLNARPVLGGVRFTTDISGLYVRVEIFRDGVVDWAFLDSGLYGPEANKSHLYPEWVLGPALSAMLTADAFRRAVGGPDAEYGLEVEIIRHNADVQITRLNRGGPNRVLGTMEPNPLRLPRLSLGDRDDIPVLLNLILTDLFNAAGSDPGRERLSIDLPK
jgi:hypothetical protein